MQRPLRTTLLTIVALIGFAANSVLCRAALGNGSIDAATFSNVRLASGALTLILLVAARRRGSADDMRSALRGFGRARYLQAVFLLGYAVPFSFAYLKLNTGTGALILFGSVQLTMMISAWTAGERPSALQALGWLLAVSGLVYLLLPGLSAPSPVGAMWMIVAGCCWGFYSLAGRGSTRPLRDTRDNFLLAAVPALALNLSLISSVQANAAGLALAVVSGSLTSACGYAVWYEALRHLSATRAATVQLAVPPVAAVGGILTLGEALTQRLLVASIWILGGIGLELVGRKRR